MSRKNRIATAVAAVAALAASAVLSSTSAQADTSWGAPSFSLFG